MKKRRIICGVLAAAHLGVILWIKLGVARLGYHPDSLYWYWEYLKRNIQIVPIFVTIFEQVSLCIDQATYPLVRRFAALTLASNLCMWFPSGFLLPLTFPSLQDSRRFVKCIVALTALVEALQALTLRGSFDIDDILLNCAGALAGFWLYGRLRKRFASPPKNGEAAAL